MLYRNMGAIPGHRAVYGWMTSDWRPPPPPNKDIDKNRETANIGLVTSVGRAPARQTGGRSFKSSSSQFVIVQRNPTTQYWRQYLSLGSNT